MTEDEYTILEDLFMMRWTDKRGNSLMKKCEVLYDLAKNADGGRILELGTYHGCGAISLAFGARAGNGMPVYTIDDHVKRKGWAGEDYYPQDKARFFDCVMNAGVDVTLISMNVDEAFPKWDQPIALLFWDLGMKNRLREDLHAWGRLVVPGGIFAIREGGDRKGLRQLGSESVMADAVKSGTWFFGKQHPKGHVYTLEKR